MRGFLAIGLCAVYLAFGFVAGAAHVHEFADLSDERRGLHLDHAHLDHAHGDDGHRDESAGTAPSAPHRPGPFDTGGAHLDARHAGHDEGDVLYLAVSAQRLLESGPRLAPAIVAVGATIDSPTFVPLRRSKMPDRMRGPPRNGTTPPRAPPA